MTTQPQQHIVQIGTKKQQAVLSKSQKEFNRLIQKIETLDQSLHDLREATQHIQQRVQADYRPLLKQYSRFQADLVRVFDRAYESDQYSKAEKKKLVDLIQKIAFELIDNHGIDELRPIYDKHVAEAFNKPHAQTNQQSAESLKEMMEAMYGITFGEDVDVSDPQKMQAYVQEQLAQREAAEAEHRAAKPKSEKKQEREARKQAEARNITKAVRTLYLDLVKAFHPDREPDEDEKERKTKIMHRVTDAYEKSDLLALLRLQLEFERIDQSHLETLAEEQLKYYNKILRQQAQELDDEFLTLQKDLAAMTGKAAFTVSSPIALEFSLNTNIAQLKREIKQIKSDVKALVEPAILKQWLKTYRIQEDDEFSI